MCENFTPIGGAVVINAQMPRQLIENRGGIKAVMRTFEALKDSQMIASLCHRLGKYWSYPRY